MLRGKQRKRNAVKETKIELSEIRKGLGGKDVAKTKKEKCFREKPVHGLYLPCHKN